MLLAAPAAQAGCTAAPLASLPLRSERGHVLVEILINDQPAWFAVDTGAANSVMNTDLAKRLQLSTGRYPSLTPTDISGNQTGGKLTNRVRVSLGRQRILNQRRLFVADLHTDGLLAGDLLGGFDIDLDFAGARMNLFGRGICADPPGDGPSQAIPSAVTDNRVYAPVLLDGKELLALVDTGAPRSYIAASKAQADFGIRMDDARTARARGAYGGELKVMPQDFHTLAIGGFTLEKPSLSLTTPETGFAETPVVLGLEHLQGLRLFIAYGARRLTVSPASRP
jgi:predicted aspartyl protease